MKNIYMYLRPIDIPRAYTPKKTNFQTMGILFSLCKLGGEITRSEFKMQEMAEMLIQDRADQVSGDWLC